MEEKKLTDEEIVKMQSENKRLSLIAGILHKGVAVEIVNMQETIDKQKTEIERLTKNRDYWLSRFDEKAKENAELQKQVDELKVYLASEKVCSKQTVKDTAKEIFAKVKKALNHLDDEWEISNALYPLEKEYSVEVE